VPVLGMVIPEESNRRITMDSRLSVRFKRGGRRPRSHGGYSFLTSGQLPVNRTNILRYLMAVREGLIRDLGPCESDLSTARIVIIDRSISLLGIIRCIEEHARENGVFLNGELAPSLQNNYLAYCNSLRLNLAVLGLDAKKADETLNLSEYARCRYGDQQESEK